MKRVIQPLLAAGLLALPLGASAQTPDARPALVTIMVTQLDPLPKFGNLVEFTAKLLELQLAQDGFSRVSRVQEEPPCVVAPRDSLDSTGRSIDGREPQRRSDTYTLAVSLHNEKTSGSGADVRLDYRLARFRPNCERKELFQRSESFPESAVLENLTLTAQILSLRLGNDAMSLPVVELSMNVTGSTLEKSAVAQGLVERILRDLVRSGELDARIAPPGPSGQADYYVTGAIGGAGPPYSARFTIKTSAGDPIALPAIEVRSNVQAFYESASKSVVSVIDDLRYSRAAGLTTTRLTDLSPEQLRSRAMSLLCLPAPQRGCVQQPLEAEPVLARLVEKTKTAEVYEWLGIAQAGSGKPVAAAESFRLALADARDAATRARVTRQLADSLYEGKQYDAAALQYDSAYGPNATPPADAETYVRWARSHRLGKGGGLRAAEVLIAGTANPNLAPLPLQTEFREVVATERVPVLTRIYAQLSAASSVGTGPLLDVTRRALAQAHLVGAEVAHGGRDFKTMDTALGQAEALANDLAADSGVRETMARLRGLWYRDRDRAPQSSAIDDYRQAESFLRQALSWEPLSPRTRFALATTYMVWPGEVGIPGPHKAQAVALLKDLTLEHFPTAAENLVAINRVLKQNEETRAILEDAIKRDPTDRSALDALMDVCTDSLFAYECAAAAAEKLDGLEGSKRDISSQLEIAEIEVLAGRRPAASERLDRILANTSTVGYYRTVALFYQIWLRYLSDATNEPSDLLQQWQAGVKAVRTVWNFPGARHALENMPPFSAQRAERLLGMIKQMEGAVR